MPTKSKPRPALEMLPTGRRGRADAATVPEWVDLPANVVAIAGHIRELAERERSLSAAAQAAKSAADAAVNLDAGAARDAVSRGEAPPSPTAAAKAAALEEAQRAATAADEALNRAIRQQDRAMLDAIDEWRAVLADQHADHRTVVLEAIATLGEALTYLQLDQAVERALDELQATRHWSIQMPRREDVIRRRAVAYSEERKRSRNGAAVEREALHLLAALQLIVEPPETPDDGLRPASEREGDPRPPMLSAFFDPWATAA